MCVPGGVAKDRTNSPCTLSTVVIDASSDECGCFAPWSMLADGPVSETVRVSLSSGHQPTDTNGAALVDSRRSVNDGIDLTAAKQSGAIGQRPLLILFNNTFFVTLRRDAARVAHVASQIEHVLTGASILWAFDGRNISDGQIDHWKSDGYIRTNLDIQLGSQMDPSTHVGSAKIGCLMSHVQLWERLASEPHNDAFYMVLEDDTITTADFDTRYPKLLAELDDLPWDWVFLYVHPMFASKNIYSIPGKQLLNRGVAQWGSQGYLVSKRGARKLLDLMLPCPIPNDMALAQLITDKKIQAFITKESLIQNIGQLKGRGTLGTFGSNIW